MARYEVGIALVALIAVAFLSQYKGGLSDTKAEQFDSWANKYSKFYADDAEKAFRRSVWMSHFAYVETHNTRFERGLETYDLEMNAFADIPNSEFAEKYLMKSFSVSTTAKCTGKETPASSPPSEIDWTTKGAVTPIKNQGQCGSCWAFSTTGSLEGAHFQSTSTLASFSEQHLVDCSHTYGNNGCGGGLMNMSFWYVMDHGIALEEKYPYKGVTGSCHYNETSQKAWTISNCVEVTVDKEANLLAAVSQRPVSVAIEANHLSFQLYKSGVYGGNCGTNLDHGVLAVGYGTMSGKGFWKVKNSWGAGWGSSGFIMIERTGDGKGKCGIQMAASYPLA